VCVRKCREKGGDLLRLRYWRLGALWQGWATGWMLQNFKRSRSGMSFMNDDLVVA